MATTMTHVQNERLAFRADLNPVETLRAIEAANRTIRADDASDRPGGFARAPAHQSLDRLEETGESNAAQDLRSGHGRAEQQIGP
jgi:hypothetical protein